MPRATAVKRSFRAGIFTRLFAPVDGASLAVFRIAFGAIMLWQMCRYLSGGLIDRYWIVPGFHFTYPGFSWVQPWPWWGMYLHVGVLGVLAGMIAFGIAYRVAVALFFVGFTYLFLLEHTLYLNHYYLVCLISFLLIFIPAHRCWSMDAANGRVSDRSVVPYWSLALLRAQMGIVYFYGGIAKLHSDWFQGRSVHIWLEHKAEHPWLGPIFERPETFQFIAWGGLAFDLLIVPLLLWKRTRPFGFAAALCFHLLNAWFFHIGIFPWFSIAATTLFFEPSWPRTAWQKLNTAWSRIRGTTSRSASVAAIGDGELLLPKRMPAAGVVTILGVYLSLQLLIPFRHWLYPGNVNWTEEGHQFSWQMKLRDKSGSAEFVVFDPSTQVAWREDLLAHLQTWQARAMVKRPELIRQFAHHLAKVRSAELGHPVEVRVHSRVSLNGHPKAMMIDPATDLSREPYRIGSSPWIVHRPLPPSSSELASLEFE